MVPYREYNLWANEADCTITDSVTEVRKNMPLNAIVFLTDKSIWYLTVTIISGLMKRNVESLTATSRESFFRATAVSLNMACSLTTCKYCSGFTLIDNSFSTNDGG